MQKALSLFRALLTALLFLTVILPVNAKSITTIPPVGAETDTTGPTVLFTTSPVSTTTGKLTVTIEARDPSRVTSVTLSLAAATSTSPYFFAMQPQIAGQTDGMYDVQIATNEFADGAYVLTAVAYDGAGNMRSTPPVTFSFANNNPRPHCTDSDSGRIYGVRGTTFGSVACNNQIVCDSNPNSVSDTCADGQLLLEYYCKDELATVEYHSCPFGCSNGACLSQISDCIDPDGGQNYFVQGFTTGYLNADNPQSGAADLCTSAPDYKGSSVESGGYVLERYCENNKVVESFGACEYGCKNGACQKTATTVVAPTPEPTGCIGDGGLDDTLGKTSCCSGRAVEGSTLCENQADWFGSWASCTQVCGYGAKCPYGPTGTPWCPCPSATSNNGLYGKGVCVPTTVQPEPAQEDCVLNNGLICTKGIVTETEITLLILNNKSDAITAGSVAVSSPFCSGTAQTGRVIPGNSMELQFPCAIPNTVTTFSADISAAVTVEGGSQLSTGTVVGFMQKRTAVPEQSAQVPPPLNGGSLSTCAGCMVYNSCYEVGYRMRSGIETLYCTADHSFVAQAALGAVCTNNFECATNLCDAKVCTLPMLVTDDDISTWGRVTRWFEKYF